MSTADIAQEYELRLHELTQQRARESAARSQAPSGATECADCGEPIPLQRLAAQPSATRCVECQGLVEGRARHQRRELRS